MSDLTAIEKRKLERAFGMGSGYVLNFSNRTMEEFFLDTVGIEIYDEKYNRGTGSKANRMREFWDVESNHTVGKVLGTIFDNWEEFKSFDSPEQPPEECLKIVQRLKDSAPVPDLDALTPNTAEETFENLSESVRKSIEQNKPEEGLDRLHTFLIKYFRTLCQKRGLSVGRDKPLHSLVGEYIKALKQAGEIESEMTERILKGSISVMEAFNKVRNEQSYAHDNTILNYNESLLIFKHVTSSVRFINVLEGADSLELSETEDSEEEPPF